jgi:hypothetical protein
LTGDDLEKVTVRVLEINAAAACPKEISGDKKLSIGFSDFGCNYLADEPRRASKIYVGDRRPVAVVAPSRRYAKPAKRPFGKSRGGVLR